jgi:hypothetical protein
MEESEKRKYKYGRMEECKIKQKCFFGIMIMMHTKTWKYYFL